MPTILAVILLAIVVIARPAGAGAGHTECTLLKQVGAPAATHRSGNGCDTPVAPASTFKLAIALMGFEDGILTSPDIPALPYNPQTKATFKAWRQTTTPRRWLQYSVVWYSQAITRALGMQRFQYWVDRFDYGNRDLSGAPGQNDGLNRAWLSSSLRISPDAQIAFLEKLVTRQLGLSAGTYRMLDATVERFEADGGLTVAGKTGTGFVLNANGGRSGDQYGWFVGWFVANGRTYVFARVTAETAPVNGFASQRTRAGMLADLAGLLPPP